MTEAVTTVEYDLSEIIKDPVEAIVAKLITMSTAQVVDLRDMEMAKTEPKRRSTLVSALNEVIGQRESEANGQTDDQHEAVKDEVINRQTGEIATLRAALAGAEAKAEAFDTLAAALAGHGLIMPGAAAGDAVTIAVGIISETFKPGASEAAELQSAQGLRIKELEADCAALRAQIEHLDFVPATEQDEARRMKESAKVEHFTRVVFAGADDLLLAHLPGLLVEPHHIDLRSDGGIELKLPLSFPVHGPAGDIHSIWLTGDSGKTGRVSRLLAPLPTGGGKAAEIPAGHLLFREPAKAAA